jgi:hypothetical protein
VSVEDWKNVVGEMRVKIKVDELRIDVGIFWDIFEILTVRKRIF